MQKHLLSPLPLIWAAYIVAIMTSSSLLTAPSLLLAQGNVVSPKDRTSNWPELEYAYFGKNKTTSTLPQYVRFKKSEQLPPDAAFKWLRRQYHLSENFGWQLLDRQTDELGTSHIRYKQTYEGIPIEGHVLILHISNNLVTALNGVITSKVNDPETSPQLSEQNALQKALQHIGATHYRWQSAEQEAQLKQEKNNPDASYFPKGTLAYAQDPANTNNPLFLCYKFDIYADEPLRRADVLVNANNGQIVAVLDRLCTGDVSGTAITKYSGSRTITTDYTGTTYRLRETGRGGGIQTYNNGNQTGFVNTDFTDADNYWNNVNSAQDEAATDAHWGAEMTYDYYLNTHGRQSIDNNNMVIKSYVHYGTNYFNAFWDGDKMAYGDGSGGATALTCLDIAGHEMTHGVTQFTSGLNYVNESGALNEAFSDIFGTTIEFYAKPSTANWLVGNEIGVTLRSMSNPNAYGDPDTYDGTNWYVGSADNGGVHTNSGVANFWYYLLCTGGSGTNDLGNAYNVTGIGMNNARLIAYRTLAYYLVPSSDYAETRFYSIQAANDLFGPCSSQAIAVTNAWYAVGVGGPYSSTIVANFTADVTAGCAAPLTVKFANSSINGGNFYWDFGDGNTSTDPSPTHIYTALGDYSVQLVAEAPACGNSDTLLRPTYISIQPTNPCVYNMQPQGDAGQISPCSGILYDAGGQGSNYPDNVTSIITIAPPNASTVSISFQNFDLEVDYDYLYLYNGTSDNAPNIGYYTGTTLPNGGNPIVANSGAITVKLVSDPYVNGAGFKATWSCTPITTAPVTDFVANVQTTCSGNIQFSDRSTNAPQSWNWNFGDGNTSTQQHPAHQYATNGTFNVSLTTTNSFGTTTTTKNNYITVSKPAAPTIANANICTGDAATFSTNSSGTVTWYDSSNAILSTGNTYQTPPLTSNTTYYADVTTTSPVSNVGMANRFTGNSASFGLSNRWLIFDVYQPVKLLSVKVYANGGFSRTIQLRNSAGIVLQDTTIYVNDGESRITLDFDLPVGTGLQLGTAATSEMYRNSTGAVFPYTLSGVLSITGTNATSGYYYFFYDWQVQLPDCVSLKAAPVAFVKLKPIPTITGNSGSCEQATDQYSVLNPTVGYTYEWTIGGGTIVSGQGTPTIEVLWDNPTTGGTVQVVETNP